MNKHAKRTTGMFVCMFKLVLNFTVNSYGHVGTLLSFYEEVITSKKYNHPSNCINQTIMVGLTRTTFCGRLTSNKIVSQ